MIYGYHPVRELLRRRPQTVARVLVAARRGKRRDEIESLCRRHRVTVEAVPRQRLDALLRSSPEAGGQGAAHNGFVALRRRSSVDGVRGAPEPREAGPREAGPREAGPRDDEPRDDELVVLLEDVQDPRNLGALLRVCEAAGVGEVLIRDRGSAPISPLVVKASAGAAGWLSVERIVNPARRIANLKEQGFWVYGADAAGDRPWKIDLTGKVLLCFGGEASGLRVRTRRVCDRLMGLPMRGRVASLNVATAAAALLYEAVRQRSGTAAQADAGERLRGTEKNR